ncbi:hypothetical protein [Bacillus sp. X1(2014)]|uniref:hypothetical protein n=1 Tax=Bacillus sp. X1(2014) TaxID=1565991 RepID=UPI001642BA03|nr:hypothetical protein [Bacillus sp. X1(2014)]
MNKRIHQLIISLLVIILIILTGCTESEISKEKNDTKTTSINKKKEVNTNETIDASPSQSEVPEQKTANKKLLPATIVRMSMEILLRLILMGRSKKSECSAWIHQRHTIPAWVFNPSDQKRLSILRRFSL